MADNISGREKHAALDAGLREIFKALRSRPVPDRLRSVVDELDEGQTQPSKKQALRR